MSITWVIPLSSIYNIFVSKKYEFCLTWSTATLTSHLPVRLYDMEIPDSLLMEEEDICFCYQFILKINLESVLKPTDWIYEWNSRSNMK